MELKHQHKAHPPHLSFHSLWVSLAPLLAQSPRFCILSLAVFTAFFSANLCLCCFPFPVFIRFMLASIAFRLSSVHLILYNAQPIYPSSFFHVFLLYVFLIYQSIHSFFSLSTPPCFLSSPLLCHLSVDFLHNPPLQSLLVAAPVVEG